MNWRDRADRLRALPLPEVLAALEAMRDPRNPAKWRTTRGVLSVSGPKFINWSQSIGGGGAINLVMHLRRVGFGQALEWLEQHFESSHRSQPATIPQTCSLALPARSVGHWPPVQRYLVEERKLPARLLQPLIESGVLYADARANAVFILVDDAATAVGAELRGTTALGWRGMAPGSRKDRGFFRAPATTSHPIVLCESAIDALSCHALHPNYRCLSTSGARPDPAWLAPLIGQGLPIYCGFDADPTGDAMARECRSFTSRAPVASLCQRLERSARSTGSLTSPFI